MSVAVHEFLHTPQEEKQIRYIFVNSNILV